MTTCYSVWENLVKSWINSNRTKTKKIMFKIIRIIRIGFLHATYHRNMKWASKIARTQQNIVQFKKYIYRAENAWRKLVILTNKNKPTDGKESST